jgi:hypothetical protein
MDPLLFALLRLARWFSPVGLMAGTPITVDCSLNWRDPDTGRLYSFASGTSLLYFQDWPKTNCRKAAVACQKLVNPKPVA